MKKSVSVLFTILLISLLIPQQIHAEIDRNKLIKEAKEAAQYGTPLEVHQIPYSTNPGWEENVKHYEGVPVEQVKKDAEEIHKRKNQKVSEPIELTIAKKCQPFIFSLTTNPLFNLILFFPRIVDSIQDSLNSN